MCFFEHLKDEIGITYTHAFQKILDESGCKPNRIWIEKDAEFYNRSMKSWLKVNGIEMYSAPWRQSTGSFGATSTPLKFVPLFFLFKRNLLNSMSADIFLKEKLFHTSKFIFKEN